MPKLEYALNALGVYTDGIKRTYRPSSLLGYICTMLMISIIKGIV